MRNNVILDEFGISMTEIELAGTVC